jgi:hypothetical protein
LFPRGLRGYLKLGRKLLPFLTTGQLLGVCFVQTAFSTWIRET